MKIALIFFSLILSNIVYAAGDDPNAQLIAIQQARISRLEQANASQQARVISLEQQVAESNKKITQLIQQNQQVRGALNTLVADLKGKFSSLAVTLNSPVKKAEYPEVEAFTEDGHELSRTKCEGKDWVFSGVRLYRNPSNGETKPYFDRTYCRQIFVQKGDSLKDSYLD